MPLVLMLFSSILLISCFSNQRVDRSDADLAELRKEGTRTRPIIMCGCVPSRYGDDLPHELPEVAALLALIKKMTS